MIAYFDTSALVPLLLDEPGSVNAIRCWLAAERVMTARVTYAEARAALASAALSGRIGRARLHRLVTDLDDMITGLTIIELDESLARRAGHLAEALALRGYDAVQLATAESAFDPDLILVSGDLAMLGAAARIGMDTLSTIP